MSDYDDIGQLPEDAEPLADDAAEHDEAVHEDERPRRSKRPTAGPAMPSGWRTTRRGSKTVKKARRQIKVHEKREKISDAASRAGRTVRDVSYFAALVLVGIVGVGIALLLVFTGINSVARWNASRLAQRENSPDALLEKAKDNLLFIAVQEGKATGFLAVRVDSEQKMVYGIAIPDAAFIEVPGQGFERIGDSYQTGPDVSLAAVTNFFTVPFNTFVEISPDAYQTALTTQSMAGLIVETSVTNLGTEERDRWQKALDAVPTDDVALVPMPVKPISLGSQTYFEPQRAEVADLVEQWWGVAISDADQATRAIVYNGAGVPGIAGLAAQQLIRNGVRVVDTKNADRFDYKQTQVIVQNGADSLGEDIKRVLGTGVVTIQPADQKVADVIVIIGADYKPPAKTGK